MRASEIIRYKAARGDSGRGWLPAAGRVCVFVADGTKHDSSFGGWSGDLSGTSRLTNFSHHTKTEDSARLFEEVKHPAPELKMAPGYLRSPM